MHENDLYDEIHAELASGEGMPEAPRPHALPERTVATFPPGAGKTGLGSPPPE